MFVGVNYLVIAAIYNILCRNMLSSLADFVCAVSDSIRSRTLLVIEEYLILYVA